MKKTNITFLCSNNIFLHTLLQKTDMFRSILVIYRVLIKRNKAYKMKY